MCKFKFCISPLVKQYPGALSVEVGWMFILQIIQSLPRIAIESSD